MGQREGEIRDIANALIDKFIGQGRTDLVKSYANPVPIRVIAMILGFPPDAAAKFRGWTDDFFQLVGRPDLSHQQVVTFWTGLLESERYIRDFVKERRQAPANDLVSDLIVSVSDDGTPSLTDDEIVANTVQFIAAGTDTTAILITHMVYLLLRDRHRWEEVRADRSLIDAAVEETLRYRGPVRGLNRVVTRDCELGGVKLPKGARLYFMPASANRDETQFEHADRFDMHRPNKSAHLAFSALTHFCIGAPLARLEARVALECLMDRIPDLHMPQQDLQYVPNFVTPTPLTLQVEWDGELDLPTRHPVRRSRA